MNLHYETTHFVFHAWSPERKALFVDYRMRGMSTDWAVFWSCVDRGLTREKRRRSVYCQDEVERLFDEDTHYQRIWASPIGYYTDGTANLHKPPKELFDELEEVHG